MARQITILDILPGAQGRTVVNGVFWFAIGSATARVPKPGLVSKLAGVTGSNVITTAEQASLESGATLEVAIQESYASSANAAYIETDLAAKWTDQNTYIQGLPATRAFFGLMWNGASWA